MAKEYVLRITSGGGDSDGTNTPKFLPQPTDNLKKAASNVLRIYNGTALVRNTIDTGISLISVRTGNDNYQRRIQAAVGLAETTLTNAAMFLINPLAGALSTANTFISMGAEIRRNQIQRQIEQLEAGEIRRRAGSAFNRSRESGDF